MKRSYRRSRTGRGTWLLLPLGLLIAWLISRGKKPTSASTESPSNLILRILTSNAINKQTATWWVAVSAFETGNWTSALYNDAHNMFGMKQPQRRETLSIGEKNDFAAFRNNADSVGDLLLYMQEFNYPASFDSLESMVNFMKSKGYFEESVQMYFEGVKSRLKYAETSAPSLNLLPKSASAGSVTSKAVKS